MVMLWSLLSDARAFLSSAVGLDRGALTIARVADTFNGSCSAFVSASSLFLMADSDALMRSTTGICSEAAAKFSHFGWDILLWLGQLSVGQVFHPLLLYVRI